MGREEIEEVEKVPLLAEDQAAQASEADVPLTNHQERTSGDVACYTTLPTQDPAIDTAAPRDLQAGNHYTEAIFHPNCPIRAAAAAQEATRLRTSAWHRAVASGREAPALRPNPYHATTSGREAPALRTYPYHATTSGGEAPLLPIYDTGRAVMTQEKKLGHFVQTFGAAIVPAFLGTLFYHYKPAALDPTGTILFDTMCFLMIYANAVMAIDIIADKYKLRSYH